MLTTSRIHLWVTLSNVFFFFFVVVLVNQRHSNVFLFGSTIFQYHLVYKELISLVGRVFTNGPGDLVSIQVESYQRFKNWYLIPLCLTLSNRRHVSRVKWSNPENRVAPSPTYWCIYIYRERDLVVKLVLPSHRNTKWKSKTAKRRTSTLPEN